jgi:predicted CoA-binding protein
MSNKTTLVLGASPNPARYGFIATQMLTSYNHLVVAFGLKKGMIGDIEITQTLPQLGTIDTVTLYLGPQNQTEYIDYLIKLNPRRIIFNPGTENPLFIKKLEQEGILPVVACTLVLLRTDQY